MRTGRPKKPLEIGEADGEKLKTIARRPKSAQAMAMRARIVLFCGQGMSNSEVARKLHITGATVGKWRERFREFGLDGLLDEPRVGTPRKITDQQVEEVITKTLESMPKNSTHWSTRLMAAETGLSQNAIVRIWRVFGLQPHRVENFKFSKDPQFVEKVRDIVGLISEPARPRHCLVRGRKEPSAGAESDRTDSAAGARRSRAPVA
jgi:transposase